MARSISTTTQLLDNGLRFDMAAGCLLVPPTRLVPDADQPRTVFDRDKLMKLKADVDKWRQKGRGLGGTGYFQPALGRWEPGAFLADGSIKGDANIVLVDGERRWRVSWHDADPESGAPIVDGEWIPVVLDSLTAKQARDVALRSSLHNDNLTPIEEAHAFLEKMQSEGWNVTQLAIDLEIGGDYIQNRLRLLGYEADVVAMVEEKPDTLSSARIINKVQNPIKRAQLIQSALKGDSYKKIETSAAGWIGGSSGGGGTTSSTPDLDVTAYFDNAIRHLTNLHKALRSAKPSKKFYSARVTPKLKEVKQLIEAIENRSEADE